MNPFQNTVIQIASIEAKMASTGNMKYILTATDKKKFYFYQKAKGQDSDVYQVFNNMGVKQGSTIAIGYTEEEKSFEKVENGKPKIVNYTDRFIGSMREANAMPAPTPLIIKNGNADGGKYENKPNTYVKEECKVRNFDREAYEKCCSIWLAAVFHNNVSVPDEGLFNTFWNSFQAIRKDGEKRFSTGWAKAEATFKKDEEPLPEDPNDDRITDVSDIPF